MTTAQGGDNEVKVISHADRGTGSPGVSGRWQVQSDSRPSESLGNLLQAQQRLGEELMHGKVEDSGQIYPANGQGATDAALSKGTASNYSQAADSKPNFDQKAWQINAKGSCGTDNVFQQKPRGSTWGKGSIVSDAGGDIGPLRKSVDAANELLQHSSPQVPDTAEDIRAPDASGKSGSSRAQGSEQLRLQTTDSRRHNYRGSLKLKTSNFERNGRLQ